MLVGCASSFDCVLYGLEATQSIGFTQDYDVKTVQDFRGADCGKIALNEKITGDWKVKLIGSSKALARSIQNVAPGGFFPPFQNVIIAQPVTGDHMPSMLVGTWVLKPGSKINLQNADCGEFDFSVERYADATQNITMTGTPL